jgi:transposase
MKHYAGLDVSVKETSVCIVDETGKICREIKVVSHPEDLLQLPQDPAWHLERIGLEAGPLSQWLFEGLAQAGLPVVCIETRHGKAFLKAQVNKTDRHDARGIAQMMRVNLFRPVNAVISKRFVKKQQMQWSRRGAHLLLQTRTRTLDSGSGANSSVTEFGLRLWQVPEMYDVQRPSLRSLGDPAVRPLVLGL